MTTQACRHPFRLRRLSTIQERQKQPEPSGNQSQILTPQKFAPRQLQHCNRHRRVRNLRTAASLKGQVADESYSGQHKPQIRWSGFYPTRIQRDLTGCVHRPEKHTYTKQIQSVVTTSQSLMVVSVGLAPEVLLVMENDAAHYVALLGATTSAPSACK